jgi:hypothetical protein
LDVDGPPQISLELAVALTQRLIKEVPILIADQLGVHKKHWQCLKVLALTTVSQGRLRYRYTSVAQL